MKNLGSIFLVFLLIIGCIIIYTSSEPSGEAINIGVFEALTGDESYIGQEIVRGVKLAHSQRSMVMNRPVNLIVEDTKSLPIESSNAVVKLTQKKKVDALIGTYNTVAMNNALKVIDAARVPTVTAANTSPKVEQSQWANAIDFNDIHQAKAMAHFIVDDLGLSNIAIVIDEIDPYGEVLSYTFSHALPDYVDCHLIHYHTGDTVFRTQIRRIEALSVDAIYCPGEAVTSAYFIEQAKEVLPEVQFFGADRWDQPIFLETAPTACLDTYFTSHFTVDVLGSYTAYEFLKSYRDTYGTDPSGFAAMGYDSYLTLIRAIDSANSVDPHKLQATLRQVENLSGASGRLSNTKLEPPVNIYIVKQRRTRPYYVRNMEIAYEK